MLFLVLRESREMGASPPLPSPLAPGPCARGAFLLALALVFTPGNASTDSGSDNDFGSEYGSASEYGSGSDSEYGSGGSGDPRISTFKISTLTPCVGSDFLAGSILIRVVPLPLGEFILARPVVNVQSYVNLSVIDASWNTSLSHSVPEHNLQLKCRAYDAIRDKPEQVSIVVQIPLESNISLLATGESTIHVSSGFESSFLEATAEGASRIFIDGLQAKTTTTILRLETKGASTIHLIKDLGYANTAISHLEATGASTMHLNVSGEVKVEKISAQGVSTLTLLADNVLSDTVLVEGSSELSIETRNPRGRVKEMVLDGSATVSFDSIGAILDDVRLHSISRLCTNGQPSIEKLVKTGIPSMHHSPCGKSIPSILQRTKDALARGSGPFLGCVDKDKCIEYSDGNDEWKWCKDRTTITTQLGGWSPLWIIAAAIIVIVAIAGVAGSVFFVFFRSRPRRSPSPLVQKHLQMVEVSEAKI